MTVTLKIQVVLSVKKSQLLAEGVRHADRCLRGANEGFQNKWMDMRLW
jgi:hypothetical protein